MKATEWTENLSPTRNYSVLVAICLLFQWIYFRFDFNTKVDVPAGPSPATSPDSRSSGLVPLLLLLDHTAHRARRSSRTSFRRAGNKRSSIYEDDRRKESESEMDC